MKALVVRLLRARPLQPLWSRLHGLSLIGMNFWSSSLSVSGEIDLLETLATKLRSTPNPVVFDVGANVGDFSIACLEAFQGQCTVHAFEPSPTTFSLLRTRVEDGNLSGLRLHNLGFSDTEGEETLFSSEIGSSIASLYELERPIRPYREEFSEKVSLSTIDRFCAEQGIETIDFLKLDIEGHEYRALLGASEMLASGRIHFLQFEFGENNIDSRTYMTDFNRCLGNNYKIYRIVPGDLVPWIYEGGRSEIFATMNYFCEIKSECAA